MPRKRKPTLYPELDRYMDRHDLYQYQFAERIGMKQGDLSKRLHDKLPWTSRWQEKISSVLEMSIGGAFKKAE